MSKNIIKTLRRFRGRKCERCGKNPARKGMKYCARCEQLIRCAMVRDGYLTLTGE